MFSCGHLIHNAAVVDKLEEKGVAIIDSINQASEGDTVIVRSHGEPKSFYDRAEERGIKLNLTDRILTELHSDKEDANLSDQ